MGCACCRFAGAQIHLLQRALHRRGQEDQSQRAVGSKARPGSSGLLQLSKLLGVLRAALHLQQICSAPSVQWQRLEQLLLHEVRDSAGVSSGSLCALLWAFVRYRSPCSMVMQHAMYVLKTCIAQAERLPRVLHQLVEDHKMLDVTAGILHSKLQSPASETCNVESNGAPDLAAFCEVSQGQLQHQCITVSGASAKASRVLYRCLIRQLCLEVNCHNHFGF